MVEQETSSRPPLVLAGFHRLTLPSSSVYLISGASVDWWNLASRPGMSDSTQHPAKRRRSPSARSGAGSGSMPTRMHGSLSSARTPSNAAVRSSEAFFEAGIIERVSLTFPLGDRLRYQHWHGPPFLLLRWMDGALEEHELDWLLSSGHSALSADETSALQAYMRTLRRRGLQRR